jgi:hypothetical protein
MRAMVLAVAGSAAPTRDRLLHALERLADSSAPEARLVLESGPVYLIWTAHRDQAEVEHESVASNYLPPEFKLSSERGNIMRTLGFAKRNGRRNWKRRHGRDRQSLERSVEETLDILQRVYAVEAPIQLLLQEDTQAHPENPSLIAAMRKVAKGFDEAIRRAMYTELLNATLLVPISSNRDEHAEIESTFVDFETHTPTGRPTLGAFTDWDSLRLWEPRGHAYRPIHGSVLFELAMERNPVSMRINPNGDIGGELYAHEVEMLVRAVQAFRRQQN